MPFLGSSLKRLLILGVTAGAIGVSYATISNGMEFPAAAGAAAAAPAADAAAVVSPADGGPIDQAMVDAGLQAFKDGGCRGCHGWAANGEREGPNPEGPSLRATPLDYDAIHETIACGRPGTPMPYFSRDSYRPATSTSCYGTKLSDFGSAAPTRAGTRLTAEEVDAVAYYIAYYVKGQTDITFEQCEYFYGVGNTRCPQYPHQADLPAAAPADAAMAPAVTPAQ